MDNLFEEYTTFFQLDSKLFFIPKNAMPKMSFEILHSHNYILDGIGMLSDKVP